MRVARRDVGEVVRPLVDDQRTAFGPLQTRFGEGVGRGDDLAGAVTADVQRRQVTARRMPGMPGDLQMAAG